MKELLNAFGQTIKNARHDAGLTQEALAEQAGVTTRYIMAILIFFPEIQHTDKKKEHLIHMIHLCDERDLQVATATIKALLDVK